MAETDKILAERRKVHGNFTLHAYFSQQLKAAMISSDDKKIGNYPEGMDDDQRESLEMIQHKIARILAGDVNYADHWDDIAGYATLVANRLRSQSTQVAERRSTLQTDQP